MIVTCTPSGPVRPRLIQHELLVVLSLINIVTDDFDLYAIWSSETKVNTKRVTSSFEFDKYCN